MLLKDVFDYSLEEIAELVDSTVGGVKAALNRGRSKLAPPPEPAPRARSTAEMSQLLRPLRRAIQPARLGRPARADQRRRAAAGCRSLRRPAGRLAVLQPLRSADDRRGGWRSAIVDGEPADGRARPRRRRLDAALARPPRHRRRAHRRRRRLHALSVDDSGGDLLRRIPGSAASRNTERRRCTCTRKTRSSLRSRFRTGRC